MPHKFVILVDGVLREYNTFESIPQTFDNVIEFLPEIPQGPHTEDQHHEIGMWNMRLKQLISREKNASGN